MERRSTERVKCGDNAFTLVYAADAFRNVGSIIDINLSGMGFQYLTSANPSFKPSNLSVFLSEKPHLFVDRISCEVVYDRVVPDLSLGGLTVRHCGVKFGELEPEQTRKIKMLLDEVVAAHE